MFYSKYSDYSPEQIKTGNKISGIRSIYEKIKETVKNRGKENGKDSRDT